MDFRPNIPKVMFSIIIGLIIGGLFKCKCIISNFSDWIKYGFPVILGFIFGIIFTYVIWSLFEKKKTENKKEVKKKK